MRQCQQPTGSEKSETLDLRVDWRNSGGMNIQSSNPGPRGQAPVQVAFDRRELSAILSVYGRMVAAGEWRDYGISMLRDVAIFSIFRRAAEHPIYRIEKRPKLVAKQQQYSVIGMDNFITGDKKNLKHLKENFNFSFIEHDVTEFIKIDGDLDYILHFASPASPIDYLKMPIQTVNGGSLGTHNLLGLAKAKKARILVLPNSFSIHFMAVYWHSASISISDPLAAAGFNCNFHH